MLLHLEAMCSCARRLRMRITSRPLPNFLGVESQVVLLRCGLCHEAGLNSWTLDDSWSYNVDRQHG